MRSFLGWLTFIAILLAVAFVAAPIVARPLVVAGVRAALPFPADRLAIDASVDALGLLRGKVDRIHISGSEVAAGDSTIGSIDVTLIGVAIGDRSFEAIDGDLGNVVLGRPDGTRLELDRVELAGPSSAVGADALLGRDTTIELARAELSGAGLPVDQIELIEGGLRLAVLGQPVDLSIGVVDGAITIAGSLSGGPIVLFEPATDDPWRITGVIASPRGLDIQAVLDLDRAISPR